MQAPYRGGSRAISHASAHPPPHGPSRLLAQRLEWKCQASACNLRVMPTESDLGDKEDDVNLIIPRPQKETGPKGPYLPRPQAPVPIPHSRGPSHLTADTLYR